MLRRHRIRSDEFLVQEVNGVYVTKVYCTFDELSNFLKERFSAEDREKFKDNTFVPVKIGLNDTDLTLEATFVSTKGGNQCSA